MSKHVKAPAPAPSAEPRGQRLGPRARGSMEFLLLCLERGVPPEKIHLFLLGLGLDPNTVALWLERAVKETQAKVKTRGVIPCESRHTPLVLEGGTGTDFVLPEIDATKGMSPADLAAQRQVHDAVAAAAQAAKGGGEYSEIPDEVSLEIESKDLEPDPSRVDLDIPQGSSLVNSSTDDLVVQLSRARRGKSKRIELEQHKKKKKKRRRARELLATPHAKLSLFSTVVLLTWILVDSGSVTTSTAARKAIESMKESEAVLKSEPAKIVTPSAPAQNETPVLEDPALDEKAAGVTSPADPSAQTPPSTVYLAPGGTPPADRGGGTSAPRQPESVQAQPTARPWRSTTTQHRTRTPGSRSTPKNTQKKKKKSY